MSAYGHRAGLFILAVGLSAAISAVVFAMVHNEPWFAVIILAVAYMVALAWAWIFANE